MKRLFSRLLLLTAGLLFVGYSAYAADVKIALIGDSTMSNYPENHHLRGWGQLLPELLTADTVVINEAKGGASTKTFPPDRWRRIKAAKPDFVLIQFGHNDSHAKEKPESTDAATTYQENLRRYIAETREIGAEPVLITPVRRRTFGKDGALTVELAPYADAMKAVAAELQVKLIDLYALSGELYTRLGDEGSSDFTPGGIDNADRPGRVDRTHFTPHGAREIARLVVGAFPSVSPRLAETIRSDHH